MTKLTFHLIFLGFLSTILLHELNFDSDELLSGKEIAFLYIPLVVVADICKNAGITACAVEQNEPIKLVIPHNFGLRFCINF